MLVGAAARMVGPMSRKRGSGWARRYGNRVLKRAAREGRAPEKKPSRKQRQAGGWWPHRTNVVQVRRLSESGLKQPI